MLDYGRISGPANALTSRTATVSAVQRFLDKLAGEAAPLLREARAGAGLVSLTLPAPVVAPALPGASREEVFYWSRPSSDLRLCGLGVAHRVVARGAARLRELADVMTELNAGWRHLGPEITAPLAFTGFAYEPDAEPAGPWAGLPNALLVVPATLYRVTGGRATLTLTVAGGGQGAAPADLVAATRALFAAAPDAREEAPPLRMERRTLADDWKARMDRALDEIRRGRLDKIVLTRRVSYRASRAPDCARVMEVLENEHPDSARFAVAAPGFTLLGVSPERLVALKGNNVVADALAGTAPRDPNPSVDRRLSRALSEDPKAMEEHRLVVEQVTRALDPVCTGLMAPQAPALMRLPRVQHLWSPVRGHVRDGVGLLELAERLHPTPAVGGSPREAALRWLATDEGPARGWYTGAFGWMDTVGDGEMSVMLRCGMVRGDRVELFAGAGIVANSSPEQELAETEWKLQTMQGALAVG